MSAARPSLMLRGDFHRPCGFTWINRRLAVGLFAGGFNVTTTPIDGQAPSAMPADLPDVYLFHGDPYDFHRAPGRLNACFLHWEYLELPAAWVHLLNRRFDVVVAPSRHSRDTYAKSGIALPMPLCTAAVDTSEFNPGVPPWPAPTDRTFRFVHLGGAHRRRGTDVLIEAYASEFSDADDVVLILKAFQYERHRPWLQERLAALARPYAPRVVYVHETLASAGPVFTAADVGVYPLRAECFGLPILECLASGRRVIVTGGTGADEYCTPANADFVRGEIAPDGDRTGREPDVGHLRRLMRAAYERGKPDLDEQRRVAESVAHHTWDRSVGSLAAALHEHLARRPRAGRAADGPALETESPGDGDPLGASLGRAAALAAARRNECLVLGIAGSCLQRFKDAPARARKLLWEGGAPPEEQRAREDEERARCGVAASPIDAYTSWERAVERRLADHIVACGRAGRQAYERAGLGPGIVTVPPVCEAPAVPPLYAPDGAMRFLFLSTRPFLDGIRVLLEAWDAAGLSDCQLVCATDRGALASAHLLRLLVKNPNVDFREAPHTARERRALLAGVHCLVHPTLLDGSAWVVPAAMACGRAAILSGQASVSDQVTHGVDAFVLDELTPAALSAALRALHGSGQAVTALGLAAYEAAGRWTVDASARRLSERAEGRA